MNRELLARWMASGAPALDELKEPSRTGRRALLLLVPVAILWGSAAVANSLWPLLVRDNPSLLLALDARTRYVLLVAAKLGPILVISISVARRALASLLYYALGRNYRPMALMVMQRPGWSGRVAARVGRLFSRFGTAAVFVSSGSVVSLLAGASGMPPTRFVIVNLAGSITQIIGIVLLAGVISAPLGFVLALIEANAPLLTILAVLVTVTYLAASHGAWRHPRPSREPEQAPRRRFPGPSSWFSDRMFHTGTAGEDGLVVHNRILTWANAITAARLLSLPVLAYVLVGRRDWLLGIALMWTLAVADSLDGYVARRFNQISKIGQALDPVTDRLTTGCVGLMLVYLGVIPWWLVVLIIARDLMLLGLQVRQAVLRRRPVPATRIARLAGAALLLGIPGLALHETGIPAVVPLYYGSACLTAVGLTLHYMALVQYLGVAFRPSPAPLTPRPERDGGGAPGAAYTAQAAIPHPTAAVATPTSGLLADDLSMSPEIAGQQDSDVDLDGQA